MYMVAHKRLLTWDIIKDYHSLFIAPTGLYVHLESPKFMLEIWNT
jgi:hypothetical protein